MTARSAAAAEHPDPVRPVWPDALRPPRTQDPLAAAYKDWLHVNVVDHDSGAIGLLNVSMHGDPRDPRSVAVGAALLHVPGSGWACSVEAVPQQLAVAGVASIATGTTAVSVDGRTGIVAASARSAELAGDIMGTPVSRGIELPGPVPFGSGWIGWAVVPRLRLTGQLRAGDRVVVLDGGSGYHDHNWGRWYWGDDAGWDWAALLAPEPAPVLVLSRATDRAHRAGTWRLLVSHPTGQRSFSGRRVRVVTAGRYTRPLRRMPGATAAAQTGRGQPVLPDRWVLTAGDGADSVEAEARVTSAAQLVLAEPSRRGYSYLHEFAVTFSAAGRISGRDFTLDGLGVAERLD